MSKRLLLVFLLCLMPRWTEAGCNTSAQLGLCIWNGSGTITGTDNNGNWNIIDGKFHGTTGHTHDGTTGNGPKIDVVNGLSADIATQAELNTHKSSSDHDSRYLQLSGGTMTGTLIVPTVATHSAGKAAGGPTFQHPTNNTTGFYYVAGTNGRLFFAGNGESMANIGGNGFSVNNAFGYAISGDTTPDGTPGPELMSDGSNTFAMRGRTSRGGKDSVPSPRALTIYNWKDNTTAAYERMFLGVSSDTAYVVTQNSGNDVDANASDPMDLHLGTDGNADVLIRVNGNSRWRFDNDATFYPLIPTADNSYTIGNGSTDPASVFSYNFKVRGTPTNGSLQNWTSKTENITLSTSGTTTDSTITIPQYSVLQAITVRVTTAITGAGVTHFTVAPKVNGTACQNANVGLTLGSTDLGTACHDTRITDSAEKVRITAVGATPTGGVVRVVVYYNEVTAPTS